MKKKNREYKQLKQEDRDRIDAMFSCGHKQKEIARVLLVDESTISREIRRNRKRVRQKDGTKDGPYVASLANHKAKARRHDAKYQGKKINENDALQEYIKAGLKKHWSPDEILGRMRREKKPFYASKNAIYEWLYLSWGQKYCHDLYSKRYHPKKQKKKKAAKTLIPNRISHEKRPLGAANKTRYGHYEGDTIVSGKKTGSKEALSVVYERKAKYVDARKIKNLKPSSHNKAVKKMKKTLSKTLSCTMDNGIENTKHEDLGIPTFFCDPYSSWQKPGVENVNKMIRRYIPKDADIADYSNHYVKMIIGIINDKPRKSLGYQTAYEVMMKNNLLKNTTIFSGEKIALRGWI